MRFYAVLTLLIFCFIQAHSQDTSNLSRRKNPADSSRGRRYFDSTLFADSSVLTISDYLARLEKVHETLNKVPAVTSSFEGTGEIAAGLMEDDSAIATIKEGLTLDSRILNLRNLQMFQTLLDDLQEGNEKYARQLTYYDSVLDRLKRDILLLRKDSTLRYVFRDSTLRKTLGPQLQVLRSKWKNTDTLVRQATTLINDLKAHTSTNELILTELTYQADMQLKKMGPKAFQKEVSYLWEPNAFKKRPGLSTDFKKSVDNEKKAVHYYFSITRSKRAWLILAGILFFFWVFYNFRSLKKLDKLKATEVFNFSYANPHPFAATLIVMLTLATLSDINAPAIYIESIQFFLMLVLTAVFWKRWPRQMFYAWCIILAFFFFLPFTRLIGIPYSWQRWLMFLTNIGSLAFGIYFLKLLRIHFPKRKIMFTAGCIYIFFNFLAALANLSGRLTLTRMFSSTAVYSFIQMISLVIFVRIITEAFMLQILSSRIRKKYPDYFEYRPIQQGIRRIALVLSALLWAIVFTTNLNLFDTLNDFLHDWLTQQRQVGSFTFSIWGVILFLSIIWIANFLQKYIAYFFGDTGDDAAFDNKGQRSRLLVTRLILLTAGFLLAVAASGLPVDKITVILGALGVGIGLGLQNIVSNFVSGIILIFDRPLRIGDVVELGDKKGRIKEIGIRSSTLLTPEGAEVIIPNGDILSHNIVNWTLSDNYIRAQLSFVVDKLDNLTEIKENIQKIITSHSNVLARKDPEMLLNTINDKSLQLSFFFWCKDVTRIDSTKSELLKQIYDYLKGKEILVL